MSTGAPQIDRRNLVLRCRDGEEAAYDVLLEGYRHWLKDVAAKELAGRVSTRVDPSDVVQQTLLSAVKRIDQFDGSTSGEFRYWLVRIHRCNIQDELRRHLAVSKRSTRTERYVAHQALADGSCATPSQVLLRRERREQLEDHLNTLPEDQAVVVRLRHLEGWSVAELAEFLGRSEDAVASLLKRGLEGLRKRVRED